MKKLKTIIQRKKWNMILGISDIIMMIIASYLALLTRFEFYPSQIASIFLKNAAKYMPLNLFCSIVIFMAYRLYSTQWKYAGVSDFINVVKAAVIAAAFQLIGIYMLQWEIPRSYYFLYLVYLLLGMFFIRLLVRLIQGSEPLKVNDIGKKKVPVMLIGAGEAGSIILNEIKKSTYVTKTIRCIIDDDPAKKGTYLSGIPVVGNRNTILRNAVKFDVEEIILAIPTIEPKDRKDILEICKQTGCRLSILPGLYQLINSEVTVSALREVEIEDLLGREPVKANLPSIMSYVKDRVVFVTGGGGSIGSEICRQIARYQPKKLVIIDNYENNAYEIQMELKRTHPELDLKVLIVSVQNHLRIHNIFEDYKPDIVFHAAAHKHVPLMEDSPHDAIKNNVFGTFNIAKEAGAYAEGGEIFIFDMGEPVKILDLAKNMIRLSGLTPGEDIEIQFTGLRPGEKLYEELLIDEENKKETKNKRIFIGSPRMMETEQFSELIAELDHAAFSEDPNIREVVKRLVPEYTYKQTNQQTK